MTDPDLPVLWICGPPCAGKSTTGWELYCELVESGTAIAYVDIDQLGMCYPARAADPDRHEIKARNLGAVLNNFRRAGAAAAIVSGVIDPDFAPLYLGEARWSAITFCRLTVARHALALRNRARGRDSAVVSAALREADRLDASDFAHAVIDTNGLDVPQVVRRVKDALGGWLDLRSPRGPAAPDDDSEPSLLTSHADGPVLWLYGQPAAGKSATGWAIFTDACRDRTAAYIDLGQLGFLRPTPENDPHNHRLRAANLAALWSIYRVAGAACLVMSGSIESADSVRHYRSALPEAQLILCRLRARREAIEQRIFQRREGGGPLLAGDALLGAPVEVLRQAIEHSAATDEALDRSRIGDLCIDTSDLSVEEVAIAVYEAASDWKDDAKAGRPRGRTRLARLNERGEVRE